VPGPYALTGRGTQAIGQPAQLVVTVTNLAPQVRTNKTQPQGYYGVGWLSWGDANGFRLPVPISLSPQVFDLPPGMTRLGYSLLNGSTVQVAEVPAPGLANNQLNPWDRSPQPVSVGYNAGVQPSQGQMTTFSYTVPSGRLLWLAKASVLCTRLVAPTANNYGQSWIQDSAGQIAFAWFFNAALGAQARDDLLGGPLILPAGSVVSGYHIDYSTGGEWLVTHELHGFLFNA